MSVERPGGHPAELRRDRQAIAPSSWKGSRTRSAVMSFFAVAVRRVRTQACDDSSRFVRGENDEVELTRGLEPLTYGLQIRRSTS